MLSHVERLFKLMIVYKPEEFMECLLNTNAGNELRKKGIGAVLERKFATLIPLDKLYLLYLEYYCRELVIQGNLSESVRSDTEKVLRTVDEIREAERIYAEQMPVDTLLLKVFDKMFEGKIKLETSERIDLLAGRGRLSLTVVPQSENNNKQLAQMKIACKPISEGVAHLSKIGVYDNLGVAAVAKALVPNPISSTCSGSLPVNWLTTCAASPPPIPSITAIRIIFSSLTSYICLIL